MTTLAAALRPRPFGERCAFCGALDAYPMEQATMTRLYVKLAPFLRVVDQHVGRPGPPTGFVQRTYERRHAAEPPLTPRTATACAVWPLHYHRPGGIDWLGYDLTGADPQFGKRPDETVYLEWRGREAPGARPTFHQFCRAYGLRVRLR